MKTILSLFFICSIIFSGFGQLNNSIDIIVGVDRSFRNIVLNSDSELDYENFIRRKQQRPKENWRIGVNYRKFLSEIGYIKFGLRLTSVGYRSIKRSDIKWDSEYNVMGEYEFNPSLAHEINDHSNLWFLELPVLLGMVTRKNNFSIFGEIGYAANIYLSHYKRRETDIGNSSNFDRIDGVRGIMMSVVGSLGLEYHPNENISIFGQPSFRYFFSKIGVFSSSINEYFYNYGIELGFRKNIGTNKK